MGVYIQAFYKAEKVELDKPISQLTIEEEEELYDNSVGAREAYAEAFPKAFAGLEAGVRYSRNVPSFMIMSTGYIHYGRWRETLAKFQDYDVRDFWNDDSFDDEPFAELINFSDCEGMIGPDAMHNLLGDFRSARQRYMNYLEKKVDSHLIHFYQEYYDNFMVALNRCKRGFIYYS